MASRSDFDAAIAADLPDLNSEESEVDARLVALVRREVGALGSALGAELGEAIRHATQEIQASIEQRTTPPTPTSLPSPTAAQPAPASFSAQQLPPHPEHHLPSAAAFQQAAGGQFPFIFQNPVFQPIPQGHQGYPPSPGATPVPPTATQGGLPPTPSWQPFPSEQHFIVSHPRNRFPRNPRAPTVPRVIQHFPGGDFADVTRRQDLRNLQECRLLFSVGSYTFDLQASTQLVIDNLQQLGDQPVAARDVAYFLGLLQRRVGEIVHLVHVRAGYHVALAREPAAREQLVNALRTIEWADTTEVNVIDQALISYHEHVARNGRGRGPNPRAPTPGGRGRDGGRGGGRGGQAQPQQQQPQQ